MLLISFIYCVYHITCNRNAIHVQYAQSIYMYAVLLLTADCVQYATYCLFFPIQNKSSSNRIKTKLKILIRINILSNIQVCQGKVCPQVRFQPKPLTFWASDLTTRPPPPPSPWHPHTRVYARLEPMSFILTCYWLLQSSIFALSHAHVICTSVCSQFMQLSSVHLCNGGTYLQLINSQMFIWSK